jgi:anti-sigma factor RsiW
MAAGIEPISDLELHAYVDDQLDMPRRVEVEGYLARHPVIAAQVMADLRTRDALRLALTAAALPPPPARMLEAARRLERGLGLVRLGRRLRSGAAAAAFVAVGWFVHAQLGPLGVAESEASPPPPAYVDDAVRSHRTALLRAGMRSQIEAPDYDPDDILAATRIAMPVLPRGWRILDVQVFPSREGPSVEMAIAAPELGTLSLFAARTDRPGRSGRRSCRSAPSASPTGGSGTSPTR